MSRELGPAWQNVLFLLLWHCTRQQTAPCSQGNTCISDTYTNTPNIRKHHRKVGSEWAVIWQPLEKSSRGWSPLSRTMLESWLSWGYEPQLNSAKQPRDPATQENASLHFCLGVLIPQPASLMITWLSSVKFTPRVFRRGCSAQAEVITWARASAGRPAMSCRLLVKKDTISSCK